MMPSASAQMVKELCNARVRERLYSASAQDVVSDDMLVNNVGVSAAYKSPPHFDIGDVGWTFAFACKCGRCMGLALRERASEGLADAISSEDDERLIKRKKHLATHSA